MKVAVIAAALSLAAFSAHADDRLVRFDGGIGVIPVSSGQGTAATATVVNRNLVRGVQPPGQLWTISSLKADIRTDGRVTVEGRGLLLAGGNTVGTNANQSVQATLICDTVITPPATTPPLFNSGFVKLEPNGDFRIDKDPNGDPEVLDPVPPAVCASPVLLIRNPAGAWFAAGIVKQ
jgi:hypothetical protein